MGERAFAPGAEFVDVGVDTPADAGLATDGEAVVALPKLNGADGDGKMGGDALPGVEDFRLRVLGCKGCGTERGIHPYW